MENSTRVSLQQLGLTSARKESLILQKLARKIKFISNCGIQPVRCVFSMTAFLVIKFRPNVSFFASVDNFVRVTIDFDMIAKADKSCQTSFSVV